MCLEARRTVGRKTLASPRESWRTWRPRAPPKTMGGLGRRRGPHRDPAAGPEMLLGPAGHQVVKESQRAGVSDTTRIDNLILRDDYDCAGVGLDKSPTKTEKKPDKVSKPKKLSAVEMAPRSSNDSPNVRPWLRLWQLAMAKEAAKEVVPLRRKGRSASRASGPSSQQRRTGGTAAGKRVNIQGLRRGALSSSEEECA